jgi:hypothetical protein
VKVMFDGVEVEADCVTITNPQWTLYWPPLPPFPSASTVPMCVRVRVPKRLMRRWRRHWRKAARAEARRKEAE